MRQRRSLTARISYVESGCSGDHLTAVGPRTEQTSLGTVVLEEKWPVLGRHERAVVWLRVWADLGRAPRTMDDYGRAAEYLEMCERVGVDPLGADRAHIA